MIGYVTLGTKDAEAAKGFFDGLLGLLGANRMMDGGGFTLWGLGYDKPGLAITSPHNGEPATYGNGTMIALVVDKRSLVDDVHAKAIALGGTCEGPPGLRGEEGPTAFYAGYFRDLDGNKLCVYRMGPA
jgi:catechol 2,3-dioxygenase-like lactoylglutathione lyase family enzyme